MSRKRAFPVTDPSVPFIQQPWWPDFDHLMRTIIAAKERLAADRKS